MNLNIYLNLGLCDLALSCDNYSSPWLFDWLITHDMAFLSPQSTMSHNLSLKWSKSICQIFGKEKGYSWHLDKKSIYTLFGSRTYMFLDQEMIEKGIGIKWMKFGTRTTSPQIPDVRYERGYKTAGTPSAKLVFHLFLPTQPPLLDLHWWFWVSTTKREWGRLDQRRFASRSKAPGLGFPIVSSFTLSRYPNPEPHPI